MANRRPSIYIGLGGTGILAIAQTKKLYEDEFGVGKIPPEIAFLAIDFDNKAVESKDLATDVKGDFLQLVTAVNPFEHYNSLHDQQNAFEWMFKGNTSYIDNSIENGAKQVRTTGRLYTEIVLQQIEGRIRSCFNQVINLGGARGFKQAVDVHLAMSVAGGTGAGSFITVALIIEQLSRQGFKSNLYGYSVIHGVFKDMDVMGNMTPRVFPNSYSAILDVDYLLHASLENPVEVNLGHEKIKLTAPIFKEFYVINNQTENGKKVDKCTQLCEVIGTCLYVAGNELGNVKESVASNVGWTNGNFNVQTKKGWVYGLGACQVVYKGKEIAETYAYKAAKELIRKMVQEGSDIPQKALDWTEEVNIREDGDAYNLLIDSILPPSKITSIKIPLLDVKSSEAANKGVVAKDIDTYIPEMPSSEEMKRRADELCEALKQRVNEFLKSDNGVGNAVAFLDSLKKRCQIYKGEMADELAAFNKKAEERIAGLDKAWKEYEANKKGALTIRRDEKNQELLDDCVGRPVQAIRKDKHEAKRREEAYNVFAALLACIESLESRVGVVAQKLAALSGKYDTELLHKQKETKSSLVFEYDLSYKDRVNLTVDATDIIVSEFTDSLSASLLDVDVEGLDDALLAYTRALPQADAYREKLIMDVVDELSEEEYARLKIEIEEMSSLLLTFDGRGQLVGGRPARDAMVSNYMIASYGTEDVQSRFQQDQYFLPNAQPRWPKSTSDVMKQKIIFYRVDGAILPYCIGAFDEHTVQREYERFVQESMSSGSTAFNPHFDAVIFAEMKKNDFKLKPEMKNEALFYWVCGQIFGWSTIKEQEREMKRDEKGNVLAEDKDKGELVEHTKYIANIKNKYYFWDEEAMAGKMQKWVPIDGAGTQRRDTAFNYFKTVILPQKKEVFANLIKERVNTEGKQRYELMIKSIVDAGLEDYINRLLCTNKSSVTFFSSEGGEIKLIREEFEYLTKHLFNALITLK